MDIDKMIQGLDTYFENTPKEHFEEVWKDVEKYEKYGLDVDEYLGVTSLQIHIADFKLVK